MAFFNTLCNVGGSDVHCLLLLLTGVWLSSMESTFNSQRLAHLKTQNDRTLQESLPNPERKLQNSGSFPGIPWEVWTCLLAWRWATHRGSPWGLLSDWVTRRIATCKPGKPGLTSFSETLALFFIQVLSFRKMKVQDRQNVNPGLPEKNWLATRLITTSIPLYCKISLILYKSLPARDLSEHTSRHPTQLQFRYTSNFPLTHYHSWAKMITCLKPSNYFKTELWLTGAAEKLCDLGGVGGGTLVTWYWGGGGRGHFFILTLYNFKNIGGARAHPPPPSAPQSLINWVG